jgi:seryl-tRNA synthetase
VDSLDILYQKLKKKSICQADFIILVDEILALKQQIKDYKILLNESMKNNNFDREIKLKQAIKDFENKAIQNENKIDTMVYQLYNLTAEEIGIVNDGTNF